MRLTRTALVPAFFALAASLSACGGSTTSPTTTTTTTTTQTIVNDVLHGTVAAPINGALQKDIQQFSVGQGGGTVTISLTSAIETMPDGTFLSTVQMGLGGGTYANGVCTLMSGGYGTGPAGNNYLSGTLAAGDYCVAVIDITNQMGPVSYAVAVSHP